MPCGEGFQHGGQHDPFEPVESPDIAGRQVVLDYAPVLGSVDCDYVVVAMVSQVVQVRGFSALEIRGALGLDHVQWDTQAYLAVRGANAAVDPSAEGYLLVGVLDGDLVTEESCRACAGVGD